MFFTSSLLPTGNTSQFDTDCSGGYFGWTNPVGFPGTFLTSAPPDVRVGPNPVGDTGALYSADGGWYKNKFISIQLTPGTWRILANWETGAIRLPNGQFAPNVDTVMDIMMTDAVSLVSQNEGLISKVPMLKLSQFGRPANPPAWFINSRDISTDVGGVDGCGHLFDSNFVTPSLMIDLPFIRGNDVTIPPRTVAYLKCVPSPNLSSVGAVGTNHWYGVHAFYLDGCRCGGFMESSYAMGY